MVDEQVRMYAKFLVLCGLVAYALADSVLDLTDSDFDNKLGSLDTALVMFYAPWCGHCKKLKPEFEQAASLLIDNDPPVYLAKVDCTEGGKETCSKFSVSGYPTVKIFRGGELSTDYNGPRDASGIVKFMKSQVGPVSKELKSVEDAETFLKVPEVGVVYFGEDSQLKEDFLKVAEKMRETVRFAHSLSEAVNKKFEQTEAVVLFRPKQLANKFEPATVVFEGESSKSNIQDFIESNYHGLVGHRTPDSASAFKPPLVVAYFNVDYVKNVKGTNYWRNRMLKVAQNFAKDYTFAISAKDEFQHELNEFGIEYFPGDKPKVAARDAMGFKYIMEEEFALDTFEKFMNDLKDGKIEPHIKSEDVPEQTGPVTVAVAKNFEEVVTDNGKDTLIEFYAPWCGHCKKLEPIYNELGEKLAGEDVAIVKMDATANDVPPTFNVRGFPTLFWAAKDSKDSPIPYQGGRELDDFIQYIAKHATNELNGYDRSGNPKDRDEL